VLTADHRLKIVLVEPEIPQNAGNVARLCAATGAELHLVRPLGFFLTDKHFKRAGMDYLKEVTMTVHDDLPALMKLIDKDPIVLTSGLPQFTGRAHWGVKFAPTTWIFFGKESAGLPTDFLERFWISNRDSLVQIPMAKGTRGLNLSTSAGIILYEALRQLHTN